MKNHKRGAEMDVEQLRTSDSTENLTTMLINEIRAKVANLATNSKMALQKRIWITLRKSNFYGIPEMHKFE